MGEARRRVWLAAATLPFLMCAVLAFAFAYDAPYWDEWVYVVPIARAFQGELSLSDFVVRLNEHIYVVSSLIVIPLARATHWDLRWEIGLILALYAGTFAQFFRALRRVERVSGRMGSMWAAPAVSSLLFSCSQYALWNWGLHASLATAVFFTVSAIGLLGSGPLDRRRLAIAGACGWAATFSIGGGLSVWPAGAVALLIRARAEPTRAWKSLAVWLVIGTAAAGVYLRAGSPLPADMGHRVADPVVFVLYVLAFLGGPLAVGQGGVAVVLGMVLIAALASWSARSSHRDSKAAAAARPVVIGLACAALVVGVLTATKHSHEGVANAISSRFLPWGTLAWCGLVIAAYAEFPVLGLAPRRVRFAVAAALAAVLAGSALGSYRADERHDAFLLGRRALIDAPQSDEMKFLHPQPESLGELRGLLIRHRLTVFRGLAEDGAGPGGS